MVSSSEVNTGQHAFVQTDGLSIFAALCETEKYQDNWNLSSFSDPSSISVLVPGAGLGRLAFEIARRGYTCQGNEFSLFMLFASNFVLNKWVKKHVHLKTI